MSMTGTVSSPANNKGVLSPNPNGYQWEPDELEAFLINEAADLCRMQKENPPFPPSIVVIQPTPSGENTVAKTKTVYNRCCIIS